MEENWGTEHIKGNKTVPEKADTTRTGDGHKLLHASHVALPT